SLLPRAALLGRTTLLRGASLFRCTGLLRGWPRRRLRRMERKRRPLRVAEDGDRTATRNLHWRTLNECAVLRCDVNSLLYVLHVDVHEPEWGHVRHVPMTIE